jgi:hypothetical protein
MPQDPMEDSIHQFRESLDESLRLVMEGRGTVAEMRAVLDARILESAQHVARTNEALARR